MLIERLDQIFQSTRPARGATELNDSVVEDDYISIHAPREGRDFHTQLLRRQSAAISIHAPREGRDIVSDRGREEQLHFNPRAPRGARLVLMRQDRFDLTISIHAPREGRDIMMWAFVRWAMEFQSTRPARGATLDNQSSVPD